MRQGRPERSRRMWSGHVAHNRGHPGRDGVVSDLMELATSVVEQAKPGEGMEVYVTRGTENEVRAYDGAVESLTSADSSGVGIRIVLEGPEGEGSRFGFA